jgi:hypothetical protein
MIRSTSLRPPVVLIAGLALLASLVVSAPPAWSDHGGIGPHVSIASVSQLEGDADNPLTFT